ncbi:dipeptidase [Microlunatus flavus]|uniref:Membrane dipeptidase n=1 Tax=Microlunatus flavus TaxID=1036181 RepID=A0A1H9MHD8_9ACTN|nr:dipeptidase [Microlunatus flavus]SER22835.1 membrane dipeptidase [Microlunatus flavus]
MPQPLVVDGHNDLPWALRPGGYDFDAVDVARSQPQLHTDLPRLRTGGVGGQFWSVYVPCGFRGAAAVTATLEQVDAVRTMVERYADDLVLVGDADGLEAALASGRIASLMGAEGGHSIDNSLGVLRTLHRLGVRYLTLTHNANTDWADAATDVPRHAGLTRFGREVVAEMNRLGMLVDLSHVAATTMDDALDVTAAPVVFSHSSARAVADHPRNVPDDVLARLADNGGVCMVTFVPRFVSPAAAAWAAEVHEAALAAGVDPRDLEALDTFSDTYARPCPPATLADVVAHVEHVREVAGLAHVGLGGDFDGTTETPVGLEDVSRYPALLDALRGHGWSEDDLVALTHGNVVRVLREAGSVAAGLQTVRPPSTATIQALDGPADAAADQAPTTGEEPA